VRIGRVYNTDTIPNGTRKKRYLKVLDIRKKIMPIKAIPP